MRDYDLTLLIDPDLTSENRKKLITTVKKTLEDLKGKMMKEDEWGEKDLAYPFKKKNKAFYLLLMVNLPENAVAELQNKLKIEETILRYLLVKSEKKGGKNGPVTQ